MNRLISNIILSGLVAFVLASCYKDNGNYDYTTEPEAITISKEMQYNSVNPSYSAFVFKLGEDIEIPAKYTINDPALTEAMIQFEWILGGEVLSTEPVLKLDSYPSNRYIGIIVMTDLRYSQKYMSEFSFQVDEAYTDGWALLSEKDGMSHLGYLNVDPNTGEYVFQDDVYAKSNNGASFAAGVTELASHMYSTYPQKFGLSIVKQDEEGPFELDIHTMAPMGWLKKEFVSDVADLKIKSAAYMAGYVAAITEDGRLYLRAESKYGFNDVVPHASLFPSLPVVIDGGLKIDRWINPSNISNDISSINTLIAYDSKNSRCVRISDSKVLPIDEDFYANFIEPHRNGPGWDGYNEYPDIVFPEPYDLSEYNVVAMNGGGWDTDFMADSPALSVIMLLERKSDGKLFFYAFRYFEVWGMVDIDLDLFFPVPDDIDIDPATMIAQNNLGCGDNIFYFTGKGNKTVYYLNAIYGTLKPVYTSSSEITALGLGEVQNVYAAFGMADYTPYYENFLVADADGNVTILKMDAVARATGHPEVLHSFRNPSGKVTHMAYLPNSSISY